MSQTTVPVLSHPLQHTTTSLQPWNATMMTILTLLGENDPTYRCAFGYNTFFTEVLPVGYNTGRDPLAASSLRFRS